ncbi:hypothetical protein Pmani_003704 [Petrolisthes manimaculis]|uniref:Uncharacterized protein n=1 Tax=Petrolisthes manimaculis TaxID=1843537 RepID=A0AAE1UM96_9EUCA|nr:hypothetical protein Pmani_003704 [Petrolisthes manimaculis]
MSFSRLHMLTELEEMVSGVLWPNQTSEIRKKLYNASELKTALACEQQPLTLDKLIERWDQRLRVVQTSHRYLEPILSFRRTLLVLSKGWLQESNPSQSSAMKLSPTCFTVEPHIQESYLIFKLFYRGKYMLYCPWYHSFQLLIVMVTLHSECFP